MRRRSRREGEDREGLRLRVGAKLAQRVESVEHWHLDVEQDGAWRLGPRQAHTLYAVIGGDHAKACMPERCAEDDSAVFAVIHQQDRRGAGSLRSTVTRCRLGHRTPPAISDTLSKIITNRT